MKSFALLLPLAFSACQAAHTGPDFAPIKQGLTFLGLSLVLAAFVHRTLQK